MICRSFGVLKQRWRILDHSGGRLCNQPEKAAQITLACFILHNFCRRKGVPDKSYQDAATMVPQRLIQWRFPTKIQKPKTMTMMENKFELLSHEI